MYTFAIICFTLYAAYLIGYYSGYRLHKADWLIEQEEQWHHQLEEQYEQLYAEDIRRLVEIYESQGLLIEELRERLRRKEMDREEERSALKASLEILMEDSKHPDFLERFQNGAEVKAYYNSFLSTI